jgi:serine phosphatase RsbU (regulator of sigma subunit)
VLVKFSGDVTTIVGYDNILDSLKTTFVEMLKLNCFGILIKDKKNDEFYLTGSVGFSNEILIADGIKIQKAYERKLAVSSRVIFEQNDVPDLFHELSARLIEEGIYTVVPMVIKSKVIGLLLFGLKRSGSQFAGKDLDLLTAAANQAAISIENARLYETEAEKIKMEQDLSLARKIQQGLLPKCMPNLNGLDICGEMIPAMQVGGDYYDLIQVTDTKLFVVVGDVSGKGLAASLYMTKLQTMIQLACAPNKSPKEIMVELNRRYYDAIERNSFVTMTLALFDTENKTVTFCRAGHMPVLTATNGNVIHSYRTQGIGVGLEKGIIFERTLIEEVVKLKPGQIYAFFSDGITEAMNEYYDLFGEDKLSEILKGKGNKTSTQIMNDIWVSLNTFRGSAEQNDDMTMVIVKVG